MSTPVYTSACIIKKPCNRHNKKSGCPHGDKCFYDHKTIASALPKDTSVRTNKQCQFFNKGSCKNGSECAFKHDDSVKDDVVTANAEIPCRNITNGHCTYGNECRFKH